jgi:hypothetical protein
MGIIHLSVLFLCVKSVKSGLIIPMQPELILIIGGRASGYVFPGRAWEQD